MSAFAKFMAFTGGSLAVGYGLMVWLQPSEEEMNRRMREADPSMFSPARVKEREEENARRFEIIRKVMHKEIEIDHMSPQGVVRILEQKVDKPKDGGE